MAVEFINTTSDFIFQTKSPIGAAPTACAVGIDFHSYSAVTATIVDIPDSATGGKFFNIAITAGGGIIARVRDGTTLRTVTSTTGYVINTWYRVLAVFDSATTTLTIYVNGAGKATLTNATLPTGLDRITVGARYSAGTPSEFFKGLLSRLMIYRAGAATFSDAEAAVCHSSGFGYPLRNRNTHRCWRYMPMIHSPVVWGKADWITEEDWSTSGTGLFTPFDDMDAVDWKVPAIIPSHPVSPRVEQIFSGEDNNTKITAAAGAGYLGLLRPTMRVRKFGDETDHGATAGASPPYSDGTYDGTVEYTQYLAACTNHGVDPEVGSATHHLTCFIAQNTGLHGGHMDYGDIYDEPTDGDFPPEAEYFLQTMKALTDLFTDDGTGKVTWPRWFIIEEPSVSRPGTVNGWFQWTGDPDEPDALGGARQVYFDALEGKTVLGDGSGQLANQEAFWGGTWFGGYDMNDEGFVPGTQIGNTLLWHLNLNFAAHATDTGSGSTPTVLIAAPLFPNIVGAPAAQYYGQQHAFAPEHEGEEIHFTASDNRYVIDTVDDEDTVTLTTSLAAADQGSGKNFTILAPQWRQYRDERAINQQVGYQHIIPQISFWRSLAITFLDDEFKAFMQDFVGDDTTVHAMFFSGESDPDHIAVSKFGSILKHLAWYVDPVSSGIEYAEAATIPIIVPGAGWSGIPAEPGPVGDPEDPGYDAKVIGFIDVVPWQTFDGDFEVGVVAFHMNGIDRVEFAAEDGDWTVVTEMTLNPRTNVWEYTAKLQASDFDDGALTVHAIAYPATAGEPRLMSLDNQFMRLAAAPSRDFGVTLYANSGATLADEVRTVDPGESISAAVASIASAQGGDIGGGTVYLTAGNHTLQGFNHTASRWLTIEGAPGTEPDEVVINAGSSSQVRNKTRFRNLKMDQIGVSGGGALWLDGMIYRGETGNPSYMPSTFQIHTVAGWNDGVFATDCDIAFIHQPLTRVLIQRNMTFTDIGQDLFRDSRHCVNVQSLRCGRAGSHADFVQWFYPQADYGENFVFYNCVSKEAYSQFILKSATLTVGFDNTAVVNCHIDRRGTGLGLGDGPGQWYTDCNHILLWHVTAMGVAQLFDTDTPIQNFSMKGCVWNRLIFRNPDPDEIDAEDNHYVLTTGTDVYSGAHDSDVPTTGDPVFTDEAGGDYSPASDSPLLDRVTPLPTPVDAENDERADPASTGAFEFVVMTEGLPGAPTGLTATAIDDDQIDLEWNPPGNIGGGAVLSYEIERESPEGGGWAPLVPDTGDTATTYSDTGLTPGVEYNYRVSAINVNGTGAPSNEAAATTHDVPGAPTGLTAQPVSETAISISWTAPADDGGTPILSWVIEMESPIGGGFSVIEAVWTGGTSYVDRGLTVDTEYNYKVSATNAIGTGPASAEADATTSGPIFVPEPPTSLVATTVSGTAIDLAWTAPIDDGGSAILGYEVERKEGNGAWTVIEDDTESTATTYSDTGLTLGVEYFYRVSAINAVGTSDPSNEDSATTWDVPGAPTDLIATIDVDENVELNWTAPADDGGTAVIGNKIERAPEDPETGDPVDWITIAPDTGTAATTYTDITVVSGTSYFYRVSAINAAGTSEPSFIAFIMTPGEPPPPGPPEGAAAGHRNRWIVPDRRPYHLLGR